MGEKERLGRRDRLLRLLALAFFKFEKQRMVSKGASVTLKTSALVQRSTRRALPNKSGRKTARQIKSARATNALFEIAEETVESVTATVSEISDTVSEISDTVSGTIEAVSTDVDTVSEAVATTVATTADSVAQVAAPVSDVAAQSGGGLPEGAALIDGGAVVVLGGIGGLLALLLKPSARAVSAAQALDILAETSKAKLVDLRPKADVNAIGSPDLRSVGGRSKYVKLPTDEVDFDAEKYQKLVDDNEFVIFLDTYGGFAKQVTQSFVEQKAQNVAYVADGTNGPAGWLNSEMPWRKPFSLSIPSFDAVVEQYKEDPTPANTALAAVAGVGLVSFLFVEYEGLVEFLSFFVGGSFLASKTLFAKDRATTERQIKEFLNTKEPPKDLVREVEDFKDKVLPERPAKEGSSDVLDIMSKVTSGEVAAPEEPAAAAAAEAEAVGSSEEEGEATQAGSDKEEVEKWINEWKDKSKELQEG